MEKFINKIMLDIILITIIKVVATIAGVSFCIFSVCFMSLLIRDMFRNF